jgi:hypothetical protein
LTESAPALLGAGDVGLVVIAALIADAICVLVVIGAMFA